MAPYQERNTIDNLNMIADDEGKEKLNSWTTWKQSAHLHEKQTPPNISTITGAEYSFSYLLLLVLLLLLLLL